MAFDLGWDGLKDDRGRKLLQNLGTHTLRAYDPDYWINRLDLDSFPGAVYVDDARFPNEIEFLRNNGFHIVYLKPFGFSMNEAWRNDPSETSITPEDADTIIASHAGKLGELEAALVALVQRLA